MRRIIRHWEKIPGDDTHVRRCRGVAVPLQAAMKLRECSKEGRHKRTGLERDSLLSDRPVQDWASGGKIELADMSRSRRGRIPLYSVIAGGQAQVGYALDHLLNHQRHDV